MDDKPPAPGEGKRGEAGYLGYLLRQAAHSYRLRQEQALAGLVTPPQFSVLTMLNAYPGVSGAALARLALLTPQTVNEIVKNLRRAGYLHRAEGAAGGRALALHLTESGRTILEAARGRILRLEESLADGLSPEQNAGLRRWLVHVARAKD